MPSSANPSLPDLDALEALGFPWHHCSADLCRVLCDQSDMRASDKPDYGLRLARCAVRVAKQLDHRHRCLALAAQASRLRNLGDPATACEQLEEAHQLYASHLLPAEMADLERRMALAYGAAWLLDDGEQSARRAVERLQSGTIAFQTGTTDHVIGCAHLALGLVLLAKKQPNPAFQELHVATETIDRDINPALFYDALIAMTLAHLESKDSSDLWPTLARHYLTLTHQHEKLCHTLTGPKSISALLLKLCKARIMMYLGDEPGVAWGFMESIRIEFWQQKRALEWALATLDLAEFHRRNDKKDALALIAGQMHRLLRQYDHTEDIVLFQIVTTFTTLVDEDSLTPENLRSLRHTLLLTLAT